MTDRLTTPRSTIRLTPASAGAFSSAAAQRFVDQARTLERSARTTEAIAAYEAAIAEAESAGNEPILAEALRRLGILRMLRHEFDEAMRLLRRSLDVARALRNDGLAAEATNGIALVHLKRGQWEEATEHLRRALELGGDGAQLRGRIEQNLGIIANIQGDLRAALGHYERSLAAFQAARDDHGTMVAYHNLGMLNADRERWTDADQYFRATLELADANGDVRLRGLALLNRTEVHLARGHYEDARAGAEEALRIFDRLGERAGKSTAYKFLGMLYRETGQLTLAEARLRGAVEIAAEVGERVAEAEASRELAVLYQRGGRNQEALRLLNAAHRLFGRLNARVDLLDVSRKMSELESVYLEIVRGWGRSIETADSYTFGHSERVASYAEQVARALGFADAELQTIRLGAYLHDVGKMRVPHEILNKPGRLTPEEREMMQMHPLYGLELLASIEFPWDIKPIIRSHHERLDGAGYPDRLRGDEVPLVAQVICIVDVYDALTTTRSYRAAFEPAVALREIDASKAWWTGEVFDAFMASVGNDRR